MAKKEYLIKQERKFNGDVSKITFSYECDETEIQGVLDKMEGIVTVFEENIALSSADGTSNVVTSGLPITSISMVHSEAKTQFVGAYGNRPILFKNTVSVVELQDMFKLHKPFKGAYETETPDDVYPKVGSFADL